MSGIGYSSIRRLLRALVFSWRGLQAAWCKEPAFRYECLLAAVAIPLALWLTDVGSERALLIGVIGLVLVVEVLNSAIEATIDRIDTSEHPLSARAKDLGSAAVFISLIVAAVVWGLVLWA